SPPPLPDRLVLPLGVACEPHCLVIHFQQAPTDSQPTLPSLLAGGLQRSPALEGGRQSGFPLGAGLRLLLLRLLLPALRLMFAGLRLGMNHRFTPDIEVGPATCSGPGCSSIS